MKRHFKNIYKDGKTYRVRKQLSGKRVSRNFRTLREAKAWLGGFNY